MYTIKGELKVIKETQVITDSFKKRDFVIEDKSGQYPQLISFQSVQDAVGKLDEFKVGHEVEVFFNLRGRLWTSPQNEDKYFNTLDAWKIQPLGREQPDEHGRVQITPEDQDDLPF